MVVGVLAWTLFLCISVRAEDGGIAGGPANDDCRDAAIISNGNHMYTTIGASTDGFENFEVCAEAAYADVFHDVWYRYAASCTGELVVNLCNSDFDTKVAVYEGCVCPTIENPLVPLGCNDDSTSCPATRSRLSVPVTQDECYLIRVGGYVGQEGSGTMNVSCNLIIPQGACCNDTGQCLGTMSQDDCDDLAGNWTEGQNCSTFICPIPPPDNDACVDCIPLQTNVIYAGTSLGATGNTSTCGVGDTRDVWHCWTATCTGRAVISTCGSEFDTTLAAYSACGGNQLACNDDGCTAAGQFTRSQIQLNVTFGTTYFFRVAGRSDATGNYQIKVDPCRNACCINGGVQCQNIFTSQCTGGGGTPGDPGSVCLGDPGGNGIDDACEEGCPTATILQSDPPSGTVDARQPHPLNSAAVRQGIGAPGGSGVLAEPIHIQLSPAVAGAEHCFAMCETAVDPLGPNDIASVMYHGSGLYQIILDRAIAMGAVTTITYTGDNSFVTYVSHPGNVNSDTITSPPDILHLIDNLNGVRIPPLTPYQCDLDRSAACAPADIITLIDLLNGAGAFEPWNGTGRPVNTCP
jgi:hypothetical protein